VQEILPTFVIAFLLPNFASSQDSCPAGELGEESCSSKMASKDAWKSAGSIYDFQAKDIDGNEVSLEKYRNQVVLIVNVACK